MTRVAVATRESITRTLLEYRSRHGVLPAELLGTVAAAHGVGVSTLRRWVAQAGSAPAAEQSGSRERWQLTGEHLSVVAACGGNRLRAWHQLRASDSGVPSYRVFCRAWRELPKATAAGLVGGAEAMRPWQSTIHWHVTARNAVWHMDATELPVDVLAERGRSVYKPWAVAVVDAATRYMAAWVAFDARPDTARVLAALAGAVRGETWNGTFFGGRPESLVLDNAGEHLSDIAVAAFSHLGVSVTVRPPYEPWQNGKVERMHQTMERLVLQDLPGFTHAAKHADGEDPVRAVAALRLGDLQAVMDRGRHMYNHERVHSALGTTPAEAWRASDGPVVTLPDRDLRGLFLDGGTRTPHKGTITFRNHTYQGRRTEDVNGKQVHVRWLPCDRSFIETYDEHGAFLETARATWALTDQDRAVIVARRAAAESWTMSVVDGWADQVADEWQAVADHNSADTAARRGTRPRKTRAPRPSTPRTTTRPADAMASRDSTERRNLILDHLHKENP